MADEFQATAAICGGGARWNSSRGAKFPSDDFLSPCFEAAITSDDFVCQDNNIKSKITSTDNNIVFEQREADSDSGGSTVTIDSTMQMMCLGFSSNSSSDWNQNILQEDLNSSFLRSSQDQDDGQGFLGTFYDSPHSFVSTTSCSINDPQVSSSNNATNTHDQAAYGPFNNFSNNTNSRPFWSSSSTTNLNNTTQNSFLSTPQIISTRGEDKTKKRSGQSESSKRANDNESASKKQRVATPSPLPTFKVRKENLRDQITSLQQLVSPFGKTDTASVLQEAIEYIKFLHDQVNVLSTPYMRQGAPIQQQHQISGNGNENQELRAHGLCLAPISSTLPVANETTVDFWTPTFGGRNFR